jgi:exodeoxyribonuclease-5
MTAPVSAGDPHAEDAAARLRALTDLDRTVLVEAGAGSGKTSVLAGRIIMLLAAGRPPEAIAAITYTEAAASELRCRVEDFIGELGHGDIPTALRIAWPDGPNDAQKRALAEAAARLDNLTCTTIHGFCRLLLTPYPVEAGIDPGATVADEDEATFLFDEALQRFLHFRLSGGADPNDPIAALFLGDSDKPETLIGDLAKSLRKFRGARIDAYPHESATCASLREAVAEFRAFLNLAACHEPETAAIVDGLEAVLHQVPQGDGERVQTLLALMTLPVPDCCSTSKGAFTVYKRQGKWRTAIKGKGSQAEADRHNERASLLYNDCRDLHGHVQSAAAGCLLSLLGADVGAVIASFRAAKRNAALLDFDDLLHGARDLLERCPDVRQALAARYRYVLVDEFQDTDPVQAEILWRLCGDPPADRPDSPWFDWTLREGALFLVGDPKQAIYRFRGADVQTYFRARDALVGASLDRLLKINRNFRSIAPILDWVNHRFALPLAAPGQPGFVELFSDITAPTPISGVRALDIESADTSANGIRDAEAEAVADLCARLIGAYPVQERDGSLHPCRAGDIALLAPTGADLWRYERALEARAIPVATQAGKGFFRRQEIQDLIALASTIADGRDTLALGALLRGPLVGLTEEALLDALAALPTNADRTPRLSLWLPITDISNPLLRETIEILQGLARRARVTTPSVLLAEAVEEMHVRPLLRQRGGRSAERALANVDAFLDLTRAYDTRGLRAFAYAMRTQWTEATRAKEARPDAEREAVSLITMHAAKGLEWAVVVPVNTATAVMAERPPVLDRDTGILHTRVMGCAPPNCETALAAEAGQVQLQRQRLWYVAATRARALLVLPRVASALSDKAWINAVDLALSALPALDTATLPPSALPPLDPATNSQDRPLFETQAAFIGSRETRLRRVTPSRAEADTEAGPAEVITPSDLPESPTEVLPQGGRARGFVLHKLMEEVLTGETGDDAAALTARAAQLSAMCGSPDNALVPEELSATVLRTLALPEVSERRSRLIPEYPVYGCADVDDETEIIAGIVDAVALDDAGAMEVILDWKSDVAPTASTTNDYMRQVSTYLRATNAALGLIVFMTAGIVVRVARAA